MDSYIVEYLKIDESAPEHIVYELPFSKVKKIVSKVFITDENIMKATIYKAETEYQFHRGINIDKIKQTPK